MAEESTALSALVAVAVREFTPRLAHLSEGQLADRLCGLDAEIERWLADALPDATAADRQRLARAVVECLIAEAVSLRVQAFGGQSGSA